MSANDDSDNEDWALLCVEEEKEQSIVPTLKPVNQDDDTVSCISLDLGERALAVLQILFNIRTHHRTVVSAQLIDVTQKESRKVNFVVSKAMQLFHDAYDKVDISTIDFILIEDQPQINVQMLPLAYTLREYFETLKRLSPKPSRFPVRDSVRFIHPSLKLDVCYRLGAPKMIKSIDQWSSSHSYNKALSNCAGRLLCRPEEQVLIEKYKRTHDLYDCVLQAQYFLEKVFTHTKDGGGDHQDSIRGVAMDFSHVPDVVVPADAAPTSATPLKTKKKRKQKAEATGSSAKKQRTGPSTALTTTTTGNKRLTPAVSLPSMPESRLSLALLLERMSMPLEQRQLLKAKRKQAKAKLDSGTLLP